MTLGSWPRNYVPFSVTGNYKVINQKPDLFTRRYREFSNEQPPFSARQRSQFTLLSVFLLL